METAPNFGNSTNRIEKPTATNGGVMEIPKDLTEYAANAIAAGLSPEKQLLLLNALKRQLGILN